MNAKKEILELVNGEEIEAICLGAKGSDLDAEVQFYPKHMVDEALKELDFDFDCGYGGKEGYNLFVWTKNKVIIKSVYDGSEVYHAIPRNPEAVMPDNYGGG